MSEPTVIELGTSAAAALRTCEQKFVYADVQNLQPLTMNFPMRLGAWVHLLVAAHYLSRKDPKVMPHWTHYHAKLEGNFRAERDALKALGAQTKDDDDEDILPNRAKRLMDAYVYHYGTLARSRGWDDFEVLAIEVPYYFDVTLAGGTVVRCRATLDALCRDRDGRVFILETKTGKSFPYDTAQRLLEPQVTIQMLAARSAGFGDPAYTVYNWIRSTLPNASVLNKDGSLSKSKKYTDLWSFLQELNSRKLDRSDPRYADKIAELANPDTSYYFKRVLVHRGKRTTLVALDNHARLAVRAEKLRRKPQHAIRLNDPFSCRTCLFRQLCEAELLDENVEYARAQYTQRTDDRQLLLLEADYERS